MNQLGRQRWSCTVKQMHEVHEAPYAHSAQRSSGLGTQTSLLQERMVLKGEPHLQRRLCRQRPHAHEPQRVSKRHNRRHGAAVGKMALQGPRMSIATDCL